jgi:hypothetical protein
MKTPPMRRLNFFCPKHLDDGLVMLKERDGILPAETIRRALDAYLRQKGVLTDKPKRGRK